MDIQEIARNTFTISAMLVTSTIIMLNYSWKRLRTLINTMPENQRRVRVNLRSISDATERSKYSYIQVQFIAFVFLTISLGGALIAISIMSSMMVGDINGIYAKDNFELAVVSMRVAVFCLFSSILSSGMVYIEDLFALYKGEKSLTTTRLEDLPKRPQTDRIPSKVFFILFIVFITIIGLVEVFVPYNQWAKMAIVTAAVIVLFISIRFGYRAYVRMRNRSNSAK